MSLFRLERGWLGGTSPLADEVLVEVLDGRFVRVAPGAPVEPGEQRLTGLSLPGFANAHSHAFHRALRGRTQTDRGSFWTWREQMYAIAARLDPDSYHRLATAVYAEMVAAGFTTVGEFHYLHHAPDGSPYPGHAMEEALVAAAREAGIRITLLDTCYLSSGFGAPPQGVQVRYDDGSVAAWAERVEELATRVRDRPGVRLGVAVHSVRAVDPDAIAVIADFARTHDLVLHAHVSEQVVENVDCRSAYGLTPTELLATNGALGPSTSLVHATHLSDDDVALIGAAGAYACFCPTTERDLGDGIGPSVALRDAGARLTLGTDSHAVIDPFEEMRAIELDERLRSHSRGHWAADELLAVGSTLGQRSLGWSEVGMIAVGAAADLVTLATDTPRTAGTGGGAETAVFAATAADVRQVMVEGRVVFDGGTEALGAVVRRLEEAVGALLPERNRP